MITLLIVTFLHVVFGEMVPKNLAFSVPDRAVLLLATPLVFVERVFRPLIHALNGTTNALVRLVGVEPKDEANSAFTIDEVETIVETSRREGTLDDLSGTLTAAFDFTEKQVADVTVPLSEIVALPQDATPADLERAVAQSGFSRYLLVDAEGQPTGYLHLKDVLELDDDEFERPIPAEVRPPPHDRVRGHGAGGRARRAPPQPPAPRPRGRAGRHGARRSSSSRTSSRSSSARSRTRPAAESGLAQAPPRWTPTACGSGRVQARDSRNARRDAGSV